MPETITLKQARIELPGLSQAKLARLMGVSRRTICRYEKTGAPQQALNLINHLLKGRKRK